jgi:hypothetical protein
MSEAHHKSTASTSSTGSNSAAAAATPIVLSEILPKAGLVYSEKGSLNEVLCKPKIMPIKSLTLERMNELERQARDQQHNWCCCCSSRIGAS